MAFSASRRLFFLSLCLPLLSGCLLNGGLGAPDRDASAPPDAQPDECDVDGDCDDGLFCNGFEICSGGRCEAGASPRCADGPACSVGICDEGVDGCVRLPDHARCEPDEQCSVSTGCVPIDECTSDAECDDGFVCNGFERCAVDRCVPGAAPDCDDGTACTLDVCS